MAPGIVNQREIMQFIVTHRDALKKYSESLVIDTP